MSRTPVAPSLRWLTAPLLLALACSHDSPRDNPLDPKLTPPVELEVTLDDTAGTATLTWTRYQGDQPFAQYQVQRKVKGMELWSTLDSLDSVARTAYLDTIPAPDTAYEYRVAVVNVGGHAALSNMETVTGYTVAAVQLLSAESDPEAGAIGLRWRRYRDPGFAAYELVRRQTGTGRDTTLFVGHSVEDTIFADTTALHEVSYRYSVDVSAAGQQLPGNPLDAQLILPGIAITEARFASHTASCSLSWTPYRGPRFRVYEVRRRSPGLVSRSVATISDRDSTFALDAGLHGNTEYFYQIAVLTEAAEEITSDERRGSFHRLADTWFLDLAPDDFVRLYAEQRDRIAALIANRTSIRLLFFDPNGQVQEEQILLESPVRQINPRCVATAIRADGTRVLSLSARRPGAEVGDCMSLWYIAPDGRVITSVERVFAQELAVPFDISGADLVVGLLDGRGRTDFDNVTVRQDGDLVIQESFDEVPEDWVFPSPESGTGEVVDGRLHQSAGGYTQFSIRPESPIQRQVRVEVDVSVTYGGGGVRLYYSTRTTSGNITVWLRDASVVAYRWVRLGDPASGLESRLPVLLQYPYRLGLEIVDGRLSVAVEHPAFWSSFLVGRVTWAGVVAAGDGLAVMAGAEPYSVLADGDATAPVSWGFPVTEMRTWSVEGDRLPRIGICSVESNQVHYFWARLDVGTGALLWPMEQFAETLGAGMGHRAGELLAPLSFDAGPDGRIFVLDAGNDRIQVFDPDDGYLTQWGQAGDAAGDFEFGAGSSADTFAGSICVDDEGYIYVADVFNKRIQKFAP